jgi:hypothetical protein
VLRAASPGGHFARPRGKFAIIIVGFLLHVVMPQSFWQATYRPSRAQNPCYQQLPYLLLIVPLSSMKFASLIAFFATSSVVVAKSASSGVNRVHQPRRRPTNPSSSCSVTLTSKDISLCPSSTVSPLDVAADLSVDSPADAIVTRGGDAEAGEGLAVRLRVGSYFALWYILNIVYNSECSWMRLFLCRIVMSSYQTVCSVCAV